MFGMWYATFVFLAMVIIGVVLWIVYDRKYDKWYDKYDELDRKWWKTPSHSSEEQEIKLEKRKLQEKMDRYNTIQCAGQVVFGIAIVPAIVCTLLSIFIPIGAKKDVKYFEHQAEYVEAVISNGTDLENIAITQTVIEQNEWLAKAKANLATWGSLSRYYGSGLEDLEPIVIER